MYLSINLSILLNITIILQNPISLVTVPSTVDVFYLNHSMNPLTWQERRTVDFTSQSQCAYIQTDEMQNSMYEGYQVTLNSCPVFLLGLHSHLRVTFP